MKPLCFLLFGLSLVAAEAPKLPDAKLLDSYRIAQLQYMDVRMQLQTLKLAGGNESQWTSVQAAQEPTQQRLSAAWEALRAQGCGKADKLDEQKMVCVPDTEKRAGFWKRFGR